jgi:membrane fusion protein (multidrug efflux system)
VVLTAARASLSFLMVKHFFRMLLIVAAVFLVVVYIKVNNLLAAMEMGKKFAPGPAAVSTLVVQPQPWAPVLNAVGTMKAVNGVTVSTDLAGIVTRIDFESGKEVKKGDLLVEMDTQQEEAQLHSAEAKRDLAQLDVERKRALATKNAIATSDLDSAESELRVALAAVQEARALIGRKHLAAPFDGVIGIRQVNLGQYVNPGAMVAPLQSLDPIYVEFALPQQDLANVTMGGKVRLTAGGLAGSFEGTVTAIDSRVDEATRNITVQGTVANPEHQLRPGMFANIEVLLPGEQKVITVPTSAINYTTYGDSVFVVTPSAAGGPSPTEVKQSFIKLGPARGDQVSVQSGLEPGDEVVISAPFRLRPGAPVKVNNESPQPNNDAKPHPENT